MGWDYRWAGWYFITICTGDRRCWFGDVVDGRVRLSEVGVVVAEEWRNTGEIRPNVVLDQWVIMPNHLHAIVVISNGIVVETPRRRVSTVRCASTVRGVPTGSTRLRPNSLGSIIGQFKSVCTKRIRAEGFVDFAWQPRFYDHLIRSNRALDNIRRYIADNPSKWATDNENPPNLPRSSSQM
jgi:putative transposase